MTRLKLTLKEKEESELKATYHETKEVKIRDKCQAILLKNMGYSLEEISNILDVHTRTIKIWTRLYREGGLKKLKPKPQPGNNRKLTKKQKEEIKTEINNNTPEKLGYSGRFWTIDFLKDHVRKRYSVEFQSDRSYHALFEYSGFTFHRPTKKDRRQDKSKVKEFEEEIKKNSKKLTNILLYWQKTKQD